MSKLASTQKLPKDYNLQSVDAIFRSIDQQVNALSEGRLVANYNAATAVPTTGTYAIGDFIRNSAPSELGGAGSMYVILGFICTASGTPGTWKQCRVLTGN
jgi:hypothetical protein